MLSLIAHHVLFYLPRCTRARAHRCNVFRSMLELSSMAILRRGAQAWQEDQAKLCRVPHAADADQRHRLNHCRPHSAHFYSNALDQSLPGSRCATGASLAQQFSRSTSRNGNRKLECRHYRSCYSCRRNSHRNAAASYLPEKWACVRLRLDREILRLRPAK